MQNFQRQNAIWTNNTSYKKNVNKAKNFLRVIKNQQKAKVGTTYTFAFIN